MTRYPLHCSCCGAFLTYLDQPGDALCEPCYCDEEFGSPCRGRAANEVVLLADAWPEMEATR